MKLLIIFLLLSVNLFAADRYWVGGGASVNWNATGNTNWSATSGGANNASVPGNTDNVFFDANGNSAATVSAIITVLSLTIDVAYTATMTHSAIITIATNGFVTLSTGYTIAGASGLTIAGNATMTSGGKAWPNAIVIGGSGTTKTWADDWTINGLLTAAANAQQTWNGSTLTCAGGIVISNTADNVVGTTNIRLTGGQWGTNGTLSLNLTFAGDVNISTGDLDYANATMTYESGTITTSTSNLGIGGTVTLNTAGIVWNTLTFAGATNVITLTSLLTANNIVILDASNVSFLGTSGFTTNTFTCEGVLGYVYTFKDGVTYNIATSLMASTSRANSRITLTSSDATNKAIITLANGATCNVLANFTRIDASAGRTINTFNGTVTDCLNINSFNDLKTVSKSFVQ